MMNNVIIASNAGFLVDMLREKLHDNDFRVFVVRNDNDLKNKINTVYPRFIFIEQCFHEVGTDDFIYKMIKFNHNLHIVIWTASDIKPFTVARFIHAGAESFLSLRDTSDNFDNFITLISRGKKVFPKDVEAALDCDFSLPIFDIPLTKRELQIIRLFGNTDKEIARILSITVHAVSYHKSNIYKKCGMKRKNEVLEYFNKTEKNKEEVLL